MKKGLRESIILVVDTETTGLDPRIHAVVELGLAMLWPDGTIESMSCCWAVPGWARIDSVVAQMPTFLSVQDDAAHCAHGGFYKAMSTIDVWLASRPGVDIVAAFNAPFDKEFLRWGQLHHNRAMPYWDVPWLDILPWARHDGGDEVASNKLTVACGRRGIELQNAHRAGDDAKASAQLLDQLRKSSFANNPTTMSNDLDELYVQTEILSLEQQLRRLVPQWSYPSARVVESIMRDSEPDLISAK